MPKKLRLILATAALGGIVMALSVAHYLAAKVALEDAQTVSRRKIPEILAMYDMRFGVLKIVSSTTEHAFLAVLTSQNNEAIAAERRQIEDGNTIYTKALQRYERYRPEVGSPDREEFSATLSAAYENLKVASEHLIAPTADRGSPPDEMVAMKESFEEREVDILRILDNHLATDTKETTSALGIVDAEVVRTQRVALAISGIAMVAFLIYGIFVFGMIRDLAAARDRAEMATRAKSTFLAGMSHELRTPMNAIIGFAQMLGINPKTPLSDVQRQYVQHITRAGNNLMVLIDKILLLSEIKDGEIGSTLERAAITPMIQQCIDAIQHQASECSVELIYRISDGVDPEIMVDTNLFRTVLEALLDNAIAYNRVGGTVTVRTDPVAKGWMRTSVIDTGRGIARDKQNKLFEPFHRLDLVHSDISGSGVGLAVTKDLITLMGGEIGFKSEAGRGSTFWIDFPVAG